MAAPAGMAPVVVLLALRDGVGPALFVAVWMVVMAATIIQMYLFQPERIVVEGRAVEFQPRFGHRTRRVDASRLEAVRISPLNHLTVTWEGGRLMMPKYIDGLDELFRVLIALQPELDVRSTMWLTRAV